ncbi:MAG: outer membrane protein assembly factor BamD, partial [Candidatus Omnitrophica bacterium]|nr:outer membrane protein assembly factor BamD [Candidatus Omnitrophota bacterium]
KAQYKLGVVFKSLMRYYEAEDAFNKVITNYPESEWVEAAKYQLATTRAALSHGPEYDQGASEEAKKRFEDFVTTHPDSVLSYDAEKNIMQLNEKDAEGNYNTGRFYEKQKAFESAKIYYEYVVRNYPKSQWSAKALERIQIMEKRK